MDLLDKKLLSLLDFQARMSFSQLAKKLGVSKQVAKYRFDNLIDRGIIQGTYADINASKLGMSIYLVYFKFHHFDVTFENMFAKHISVQQFVGVNVSLQGSWDYCIGIWANSPISFRKQYDVIMQEYEEKVISKTIMIETEFHYYKPKQLLQRTFDEVIHMGDDVSSYNLNLIDKKILSALAQNARISLVNLSLSLNLSANAIKQRIRKLERDKIILGYRIMINYQKLKFYHYRIFLHVEKFDRKQENKLIEYLKKSIPVLSVTKTLGYCELEFRGIFSSIEEYYSFLSQLRSEFSIKNLDAVVYFKFHQVLNYFPFSDFVS